MPSYFRSKPRQPQMRRTPFRFGLGTKGAGASRRLQAQLRQRLQGVLIVVVVVVAVGIVGAGGWGLYIVANSVKSDKAVVTIDTQNKQSWWTSLLQKLRLTSAVDQQPVATTVQGLTYEVPIFPGSRFALEPIIGETARANVGEQDLQAVYQFLSNNQSIYILGTDQTYDQAVTFYKEKLAEQGWQFVATVPPGDISRLHGAYWVQETSKRGLRIYTEAEDLWYETVTVAEAQEGLASRVGDLQARQIEARTLTGGRVDSKVGWLLNYPNDWQPILSENNFFGVTSASFKHKQSSTTIGLDAVNRLYKPVVDVQTSDLDKLAGEYFTMLTTQRQMELPIASFAKQELTINQAKAVRYTSLRAGSATSFVFFIHKQRQIVYVLFTINASDMELYNYWVNNMKEL